MDNEGTFWVNVWRTVGAIVIAMGVLGLGCNYDDNRTKVDLAAEGLSGPEITCLNVTQSEEAFCAQWLGTK